ncbi:disulfide bond formation protein B [Lichenicoccus sp.]|uniref:disulfide bond formation protein B n=1 Tax=Lichenicoccus sp. TaxID=2781899 RepID=UPI003D0E1D3A
MEPRAARRAGALAALFGAVAFAVAWAAQHALSLAPCALCLLERWPYRALILFGVLAAISPPTIARVLLVPIALAFVAAIGLSFTHVGVEQGWWPDPWPACMAPRLAHGSIAERLAAMPPRPVKPCDSPTRLFNFLPVSMTSLDLIYALLTCIMTMLSARSRRAR